MYSEMYDVKGHLLVILISYMQNETERRKLNAIRSDNTKYKMGKLYISGGKKAECIVL